MRRKRDWDRAGDTNTRVKKERAWIWQVQVLEPPWKMKTGAGMGIERV